MIASGRPSYPRVKGRNLAGRYVGPDQCLQISAVGGISPACCVLLPAAPGWSVTSGPLGFVACDEVLVRESQYRSRGGTQRIQTSLAGRRRISWLARHRGGLWNDRAAGGQEWCRRGERLVGVFGLRRWRSGGRFGRRPDGNRGLGGSRVGRRNHGGNDRFGTAVVGRGRAGDRRLGPFDRAERRGFKRNGSRREDDRTPIVYPARRHISLGVASGVRGRRSQERHDRLRG